MSLLLNLSRASLLGLILLGVYSLHVFTDKNGHFKAIAATQKRGVLADGITPYSPDFTGNEKVDDLLNLLLNFFWPALNNKNPDVTAISTLFGFQCISVYVLTVLEGMRQGSSGSMVSFTTNTGLLIQVLGFAVIGPFYTFIHLLTAATRGEPSARSISVSPSYLRALPYSLTLGYLIPTIAMSLPSPEVLSTTQKIASILLWQPFPAWVALLQTVLAKTLFSSSTVTQSPSSLPQQQTVLRGLRTVYRFALSFSILGHVLIVGASVASVFRPDLLKPLSIPAAALHPRHLFVPTNPFADTTISSLAQGTFWFLQFDYEITSVAYIVWAICLKSLATKKKSNLPSVTSLLWDAFIRPIFIGPMAAALMVVWERDEFVFAQETKKITGAPKKKL